MDIAVPAGGPTTVFQTFQELHFPEGSVVFEGEKEDVASYYQSAQLLMHTSETEGFGLCLVEACFFGLPIVAWDLPVYGDLLDHGNNALLNPCFDIYAMAQSVNRLLADPALCRTMESTAGKFRPDLNEAQRRPLESPYRRSACLFINVRNA